MNIIYAAREHTAHAMYANEETNDTYKIKRTFLMYMRRRSSGHTKNEIWLVCIGAFDPFLFYAFARGLKNIAHK